MTWHDASGGSDLMRLVEKSCIMQPVSHGEGKDDDRCGAKMTYTTHTMKRARPVSPKLQDLDHLSPSTSAVFTWLSMQMLGGFTSTRLGCPYCRIARIGMVG